MTRKEEREINAAIRATTAQIVSEAAASGEFDAALRDYFPKSNFAVGTDAGLAASQLISEELCNLRKRAGLEA